MRRINRPPGHKPYLDESPHRLGEHDTMGHRQKMGHGKSRVVVNAHIKDALKEHIEYMAADLGIPVRRGRKEG